jgi:hypothetical protein
MCLPFGWSFAGSARMMAIIHAFVLFNTQLLTELTPIPTAEP